MKNKDVKNLTVFSDSAYHDKLEKRESQVLEEAYCPNGHNLVNEEVYFSGNQAICLKVRNKKNEGNLFLSPVMGEKCKVSYENWYKKGEVYEYSCPVCDVHLHSISPCSCGGDLVALYLDQNLKISASVTFCTRFGCFHSEIKSIDMLKSIHL